MILLQQLGVILGVRIVAAAQVQAELAEEVAQLLQLFRRRALVDAVQAGCLWLVQEIGSADVGRQHAFLDQAVRVVARDRDDVLDLALFVEHHLGFGGLEVDRAALLARLVQRLVQLVQVLQVRQQPAACRLAASPAAAERSRQTWL